MLVKSILEGKKQSAKRGVKENKKRQKEYVEQKIRRISKDNRLKI